MNRSDDEQWSFHPLLSSGSALRCYFENDGNMTKKTIPEPSEKHDVRVLELIVMPKGQPTFSEMATRIAIDDEAGGEYVKLTQYGGRTDLSKFIAIDPDEWPKLRECIDYMISECRTEQE